ncbi:uncharacterized protein LOC106075151 [Biomphalaria glabrata]|uniref:Uncharacterized protein LOC106075151 n=1 Tax=Biomphalaria glabrata TaxID=6526 RepID=A0A9U8EKK9_BIOGL|nr:uncharacterized protein LOC106075151 [Biomphalaria glabrata]
MNTLMLLTLVVTMHGVHMYAVMRVKHTVETELYSNEFYIDTIITKWNLQSLLTCLKKKQTESCIVKSLCKNYNQYKASSVEPQVLNNGKSRRKETAFECKYQSPLDTKTLACSRQDVAFPNCKCKSTYNFVMKWEEKEYFDHESLINCSLGSGLFAYSIVPPPSTSMDVTLTSNAIQLKLVNIHSSYSRTTSHKHHSSTTLSDPRGSVIIISQTSKAEALTSTAYKPLADKYQPPASRVSPDIDRNSENDVISNNDDECVKLSSLVDVTNKTLVIIVLILVMNLFVSLTSLFSHFCRGTHIKHTSKYLPLENYLDKTENDFRVKNI